MLAERWQYCGFDSRDLIGFWSTALNGLNGEAGKSESAFTTWFGRLYRGSAKFCVSA